MPTRKKARNPSRRLDVGTDWEWVAADTERLEVPGGWLYRTAGKGLGLAVTFVPHSGAPSAKVRAGRRSTGSADMAKKIEQLRTVLNDLGGHARARRQIQALLNAKGKPPNGGTTH